jgi:predicted nucleic acid-binding protein
VTDIVVDSYAWVEYAEGSGEGERARYYIEGDAALYTPAIVVAELADRARRTDRVSQWTETLRPFIRHHSSIIPLDAVLAEEAGPLKWDMRTSSPTVGLADAIVLATARSTDALVLTGDPDLLVPALEEEVIDLTSD